MTKQKISMLIMGAITLASIIALVVVLVTQSSDTENSGSKVLAKVNGKEITQDELFDILYDQPTQTGNPAGEQFLEQLVNDTVIRQELEKKNIEVTDAELEERIEIEMENIAAMYGGSREILDFMLEQSGMTEDDLKEMMKESLPDQIKLDKLFEDEVEVTEEDIATYYEENKAQFVLEDQDVEEGAEPEVYPLEEVRDEIERMLRREQLDSLLSEWMHEQITEADIEYFVGSKV